MDAAIKKHLTVRLEHKAMCGKKDAIHLCRGSHFLDKVPRVFHFDYRR